MKPFWEQELDWFFIMLGGVVLTAFILGWT